MLNSTGRGIRTYFVVIHQESSPSQNSFIGRSAFHSPGAATSEA